MPRQATITAPDGRTGTLTIPDNANDEQVRAAVERVKASMMPAPAAAAPSAPQETTSSTTTTPVSPEGATDALINPPAEPEGGGLGMGTPREPGLLGTALYRGVVRPAADISAATGFMSPAEAESAVHATPGGAGYQAPRGFVPRLLAPLSALEMGSLPLFGLGIAAQAITNDERTADALEGLAGLGSMARGIAKYRAARRIPVSAEGRALPQYAGRTPNEVAYLEQQQRVGSAERTAEAAYQSQAAAESTAQASKAALDAETELAAAEYASKQQVAKAAADAEESAIAHHAATQNRFGATRARLEAEKAARLQPEADVRAALGLPADAPTAGQAGGMLQAIGDQRTAMLPGSTVGVAGKQFEISEKTRQLYAAANAIGDQHQVALPAMSSGATEIRQAVMQWVDRVGKSASPLEKEAIANVMDAIHDGDVPYSVLNDLYARVSSLALAPDEYPVATKIAGREYYRLKNTIDSVVRSLEVAAPDLQDAAKAARAHVRDVEMPFRETAGKVLGASTPVKAFASTIGSMDDPTHLERIFAHAGAAEQDAHRMAFWTRELENATDATGVTNVDTLLSRYNKLNPTSRALLASGATKSAQAAALNWAAGKTNIRSLTKATTEAQADMRDALTALRQAQQGARKAANDAGVPFTKYANYIEAERAAKAAEREAAGAAKLTEQYRGVAGREQARLAELGTAPRHGAAVPPGSQRSVFYHGGQMFRSAITGNLQSAGIHGMTAYLVMRRPKLVAEALRTPVDTPKGQALLAALQAAARGYRGFVQNDDTPIEGRAAGGPVVPGTPYLVGEAGPEIVVPVENASVIPATASREILGGTPQLERPNVLTPTTTPSTVAPHTTIPDLITSTAKKLFPNDRQAPRRMLALATQESGMTPGAVGDSGRAKGIFQMWPAIRKAYGVMHDADPATQINAAGAYLRDLYDKHKGNWNKTVTEFHLGAGKARKPAEIKRAQKYLAKHQQTMAQLARPQRPSAGR